MIRHGQEVQVHIQKGEALKQLLKATVAKVQKQGFETIAVVCRTKEETREVKEILEIQEETEDFHNGVMVLPVTLTKGLEFDAVILWKADEEHYGENPKEAKLLYVAITRALHQLYFLGDKPLSGLLKDGIPKR